MPAKSKTTPKGRKRKTTTKGGKAPPPSTPLPVVDETAPTADDPTRDVSILMPIQESRFPLLPLMVQTLHRQTWRHRIKEWVVLDGTPGAPSAGWDAFLAEAARRLQEDENIRHIQLVDAGKTCPPRVRAIGCFRNCINDVMSGEWGVWMDDDDIYPSTRVQAAVELMTHERKEVAGCSPHYIMDPDLGNMVFQFKVFGFTHATNNTMAYRRTLLTQTRYDDEAKNAEEPSFLKNHTIPMSQIPPQHAVMQLAHRGNTYNKRELIMLALQAKWFQPDLASKVSCHFVGREPQAFIKVPQTIYDAYIQCLFPDRLTQSPYDIVYYLGIHRHRIPWSPLDPCLGGSEQAVQHLAEQWTKMGLRVAVYGHLYQTDKTSPMWGPEESFTHNGVDYHSALTFRCSHRYRNLIMWRQFGGTPMNYVKLMVDNLIVDAHDRDSHLNMEQTWGEGRNVPDHLCLKSEFHKAQVTDTLQFYNSQHLLKTLVPCIFVQPNGVRRDVFFDPVRSYAPRNRYKLVYCSSYDRGLPQLLTAFFPTLRKLDERYTLDVMYGMEMVHPDQQREFTKLLQQPGVTDHGRVSREMVREFKYEAGYHLYYTSTTVEIDCISVRESALCGCIPILSEFGVFAERAGLHFKGSPDNPSDITQAAQVFHQYNTQVTDDELSKARKGCVESLKNFGWEETARQWVRHVIAPPCRPDWQVGAEEPEDGEGEATFDFQTEIRDRAEAVMKEKMKVTFSS